MKEKVFIYWARRDFRHTDNPAFFAAIEHSKKENIPLLPIFILEDYMRGDDPHQQFGYPSRFFLSKALPLFAKHIPNFTIFTGKAGATLTLLANHFDITIFVNEDIYSDFYTQIKRIREAGVNVKLYADMLSIPKETKTKEGNIYSIFTPFKNAVWKEFCTKKVLPKVDIAGVSLFTKDLNHIVKIIPCTEDSIKSVLSIKKTFVIDKKIFDVATLLDVETKYDEWYFDDISALEYFDVFLKRGMSEYKDKRDSLENEGTSKMSLAFAWGLTSARVIREKIQKYYDNDFLEKDFNEKYAGPVHYISELIWREFYKYLVFHYPELMQVEFQKKFRGAITWADNESAMYRFTKWIKGETGYPIVDAAMMELAKTGYMHNRARMIVASVLTKNFGVDWRWGQEYFRAMLIDLDETSNNGGWQWGASVGADPKPIRIFNPYLQAQKYDPEMQYQKKYLRKNYFENPPKTLIEHTIARQEALTRYGLTLSRDD